MPRFQWNDPDKGLVEFIAAYVAEHGGGGGVDPLALHYKGDFNDHVGTTMFPASKGDVYTEPNSPQLIIFIEDIAVVGDITATNVLTFFGAPAIMGFISNALAANITPARLALPAPDATVHEILVANDGTLSTIPYVP